jgi:hypothetical protein
VLGKSDEVAVFTLDENLVIAQALNRQVGFGLWCSCWCR